ncbi:hypothetical protein LQ327_32060 [Actinomycetospora endophytica]|uniref:Uncharacterized protein n=1 Tax=Actinomycetospora endophytica TaxID=2291215 RepID=A0ABS8PIB4_9PSEU|nr:hypothetical protein [Actinomycetospora endophytica]MCD2198016.1 hypothetical protein [Actinomycetospora endophytica]
MTTTEASQHHHAHRRDHDARITVPWLGTIEMSRPELVYVGGIAALGVLGFLDWPLALVLGTGHLLAADRSSRRARELGEAMEEAE